MKYIKIVCTTLVCWFLIGFIISFILSILTGSFNILMWIACGGMFILYPLFAIFLFVMGTDSGTPLAVIWSFLIFATLAVIYALVPMRVAIFFNTKENKKEISGKGDISNVNE